MKLRISKSADVIHLLLSDIANIEESEEVQPGVVLDFNAEGDVVGVEILNLSRRRIPSEQLQSVTVENR